MNKKIKVGVLFGGKSAEHEVSLQSALSVIEALDPQKYDVVLIGINKQGQWFLNDSSKFLLETNNPKLIKLDTNGSSTSVALIPGKKSENLMRLNGSEEASQIDVVFPVLHGTYGEDGTVQGLLKLANVPFVGAGVLGSAVGMDKDVMKRLLRDAGLPIAKFIVLNRTTVRNIGYDSVVAQLGLPLFVKPANLGSSVGVRKVKTQKEYREAIEHAFLFDHKILIEEFIDGREVECSVLGNDYPIASVPGEIVPQHEFYSYEAKYLDEKGAVLKIPADLPLDIVTKLQKTAVDTFQTLCCEGMARVDMFLTKDNKIFVNEINTIPGFTKISMYPKLWEATGIPYRELVDRLIKLAMERFQLDQQLQTSQDFE
ncbi:MAG: D-alanine--D-alanine ligase [Candidatus Obscuribacterales bacterium]|nr:D-alanine--D-alanine ligase [Candidatus Obscuribacterales bacterium]